MRPGSIIDVDFIKDKNPFFFGVYIPDSYARDITEGDKPEVIDCVIAFGVLDRTVDIGIDTRDYMHYIFSFYDCTTLEKVGEQSFNEAIVEKKIDDGSWCKLNFDNEAEEAKVLMII